MTEDNPAPKDFHQNKEYQKLFAVEAAEHLQAMNTALLTLEKQPADTKSIAEAFRASHTLKGMAATMGYTKIPLLCHEMESLMKALQSGTKAVNTKIIELLFKSVDLLQCLVKEVKTGAEVSAVTALVKQLQEINTTKNKSAKITTETKKEKTAEAYHAPEPVQKIESINIDVQKLDTLLNLTEELTVQRMRLNQIKTRLNDPELSQAIAYLYRLTDDLQFTVLQTRLVPVGQVFDLFPRLVRDLAQEENKEINLSLEGPDIELDRTIVDQLGEPLVHLIRNSVAHGVESKEERKKLKKPPQSTITLRARREQGIAIIEVEDDGAGMNYNKIKMALINKGIISAGEKPSEAELAQLLLQHPVSTAEKTTLVSGRGVGLGIVRKSIEEIGGSVSLASVPNKGTKFTLKLPLTLAIIKALLTKVGTETFAIPVFDILRSDKLDKKNMKAAAGDHQATVTINQKQVDLIDLHDLFQVAGPAAEQSIIILVKKEETVVGLLVDTLIDQQEIIVKPLSMLLRENKNFSGATILGDGTVALILDTAHLIDRAAKPMKLPPLPALKHPAEVPLAH